LSNKTLGKIFRAEEEFKSVQEMEEMVEESSHKTAVNCWWVFNLLKLYLQSNHSIHNVFASTIAI
jgi:hypothetical protein